MDRERTGEVTSVLVNGMGAIDAYVATYQPARLLAVAIPALVVLVILVLDPPTTLVLFFTGPILVLLLAIIGSRTGASSARRLRGAALAERVLPRHAPGHRHAQDVRSRRRAGRHDPLDQPPVRRHDDGGAADGIPDVAGARVGRCGRGGAGRGRDQPATHRRVDRVRSGARRPDHRPGVLPAVAAPGDALSRANGGPDRGGADVRDPRHARRRRGSDAEPWRIGRGGRVVDDPGRPDGGHHASRA